MEYPSGCGQPPSRYAATFTFFFGGFGGVVDLAVSEFTCIIVCYAFLYATAVGACWRLSSRHGSAVGGALGHGQGPGAASASRSRAPTGPPEEELVLVGVEGRPGRLPG